MKTRAKVTIAITIVLVAALAIMWVPQAIETECEWWQYLLSAIMYGVVPAGIVYLFYIQHEEREEYKKHKTR